MRPSENSKESQKRLDERRWLNDLTREWDERVSWWNNPKARSSGNPAGNDEDFEDLLPDENALAAAEEETAEEGMSELAAALTRNQRRARELEQTNAMNSMLAVSTAMDLDNLDWSSFDASAAAAYAGYGLGSTGTGGGGAGLGGFGAGGFGPGGAGGGAIRAESRGYSADLGSKSSRRSPIVNGGLDRRTSENAYAAAAITLKAWNPQTPYLQAIKDAYTVYKTPESLYAEYLHQRENYAQSPAFFLDCANLFFREKQPKLAIRILSNLSELKIDDVGMLRIYAWRLREAGEYDTAIMILRKVAKLRGDEPTSWRDLALTLTMRGKQNHSAADIQEALEFFHKTAFTAWKRNDAIWTALIALEELNELVAWTLREHWDGEAPEIPEFDNKFAQNLDTDLRIMIAWDADDTDIDMHVIEPSGEKVYYGHRFSSTGGLISHDIRTGYGPEVFMHKTAPKGMYEVMTHYFASRQQKLVGPATITITFYTNWGRSTQKSETMSLRLDNTRDRNVAGKFTVE
jgi:hypothetical protein